tara:strand:+ start:423 stop:1052 length:630 start_codon:yes stop_codon:yes gene_type:complete
MLGINNDKTNDKNNDKIKEKYDLNGWCLINKDVITKLIEENKSLKNNLLKLECKMDEIEIQNTDELNENLINNIIDNRLKEYSTIPRIKNVISINNKNIKLHITTENNKIKTNMELENNKIKNMTYIKLKELKDHIIKNKNNIIKNSIKITKNSNNIVNNDKNIKINEENIKNNDIYLNENIDDLEDQIYCNKNNCNDKYTKFMNMFKC